MQATDFSRCLSTYLRLYLPGQKGLSTNTIASYRDTFKLILTYASEKHDLCPEKITLSKFNHDFIAGFLDWLEKDRGCSIATRNLRLSAIRAFAKYARSLYPEYLHESQQIIDISAKKATYPAIGYLTADSLKNILEQPDLTTQFGQRDMVLLSVMYDSGARVQEICDLRIRDIRMHKLYTITLTGKGRKTRVVPIMESTATVLKSYMRENEMNKPEKNDDPLFFNHKHNKLTRAGITYILKKYCKKASKFDATIPKKVSPHMLRHSKAMHLLQAGVPIIYIRDFLGHAHVDTTEVYAKADTEMKRKAIEKAAIHPEVNLPSWTDDTNLMQMLKNLCS